MSEEKLFLYLRKCELQYRADHMEHGGCLDWLAPHCGSVADIADFLRELGFKVKEIVDEEPWPGEKHRWVVTTSGIVVYVGEDGFFCKQKER